jgi:hypothetical protein
VGGFGADIPPLQWAGFGKLLLRRNAPTLEKEVAIGPRIDPGAVAGVLLLVLVLVLVHIELTPLPPPPPGPLPRSCFTLVTLGKIEADACAKVVQRIYISERCSKLGNYHKSSLLFYFVFTLR